MGLLEKALQYKQKINSNGKSTLMDRIPGPAESHAIENAEPLPKNAAGSNSGHSVPSEASPLILPDDKIERLDDVMFLDPLDLVEVTDPELLKETGFNFRGLEPETVPEEKGESIPRKGPDEAPAPGPTAQKSESLRILPQYEFLQQSEEIPLMDYMALYEISREIIRSENRAELFDVILFNVMGQIGVSSSSIMVPDTFDEGRWFVAESRGVVLDDKGHYYDPTSGILAELHRRKDILDLEELRDRDEFRDDYFNYIAIDARLLAPLEHDGELEGAIVLGNKLSGEDYTPEEKNFIKAIAEFTSLIYRFLESRDSIIHETEGLRKDSAYIGEIDLFQKQISSVTSIDKARDIIREEFGKLGIDSYSLYLRNPYEKDFLPLFCEDEDHLQISETRHIISQESRFAQYMAHAEPPVRLDSAQMTELIEEVFRDNQRSRMPVFRAYPFKAGSYLIGFILVFRVVDEDRLGEIDFKLMRLSQVLFAYWDLISLIDSKKNKYVDSVGFVYRRIEKEIENAKNLDIPLTLVLFSIKNFKRFSSVMGTEKALALIQGFEVSVKGRLSEGDFSVRYDRHKILLVLPGKDKKYAVPLANAIRGEIVHAFSQGEMQLLITTLSATFPEDGNDLGRLMDMLD